MKLVTEYLERAAQLERLAADESRESLKVDLAKQAAAYYKLANKRASDLGAPLPKRSWSSLDDFYLANGLKVRRLEKVAEELGRDIEETRERVLVLGLKLGPHN